MRRRFSFLLAGLVLAGSGSIGAAEPLSVKQAKKLLFKGAKFEVQMIKDAAVGAPTMAQVEVLAKALENPEVAQQWQAMGFSINYYGAIAVMPDRPISGHSMVFSDNLHSPEAAKATAIAACDALDGPKCVAVALILPSRYKPRDLTLSRNATDGFRDNWGKPDVPQYLAYSPTSGAWVVAKGEGADISAIERCNEQASQSGAEDCLIAIAGE